MQKINPGRQKVPIFQMILFGLGVAVLAMINSCGYGTFRVAHALPPKGAVELITGSLETAVLTSQAHEKHNLVLTLRSINYNGPLRVRIQSADIARVDKSKSVQIRAIPEVVNIQAGGEAEIVIAVEVGANAPTMDERNFQIEILKANTRKVIFRAEVDLNVLPRVASH